MVDLYRQRGPLDHLGIIAADPEQGSAFELSEVRFPGLINVRGNAADDRFLTAIKKATRLDVPTEPNTVRGKPTGNRICWLGPDELLVITKPGGGLRMTTALSKALKTGDLHAAVTEVSDSRTCFKLSGRMTRQILAKGCSLDLHPSIFGTEDCAQTLLARINVLLTKIATARDGGATFEVYVLRSFASHLWAWLRDAADEFRDREP